MKQSIDLYSEQNKYIDKIIQKLIPSGYQIQVKKNARIVGYQYEISLIKNDFSNQIIKTSIKNFNQQNAKEVINILVETYERIYKTQE